MKYVFLIRHAQNDWIDKKRLAGWLPGIHLNQEGVKQAEALASRLASLPLDAVFSSPLERCLETARIVARPHDLEVILRPDLGEVRYGRWEGKKLKKLVKKKQNWYAVQHFPSRFRFPEGESFAEVQQRAVQAVEAIGKESDREVVAAVTHADVIKLILAYFLGIHIDLFQRIVISPASASLLALHPKGALRVIRINDAGPLTITKGSTPDEDKHATGSDEGVDSLSGEESLASEENSMQILEEPSVEKQQ